MEVRADSSAEEHTEPREGHFHSSVPHNTSPLISYAAIGMLLEGWMGALSMSLCVEQPLCLVDMQWISSKLAPVGLTPRNKA